MAIHKLHIDEFDENDYTLVAIHTSLEDYRLAYFINQKLPVRLSKNKDEIQIQVKQGETSFSRYTFENNDAEISWNLIQNKNEIDVSRATTTDLFSNQTVATKVYLLPEFKKVDYFLKIENVAENIESITSKINTISQISAVYAIGANTIKSKNNLIF
ncbi:IPExxxVDY family protein [Flavobacterium pallidum]|uniref:IPExxxVDY family protein n=1 Tax=Flavobacterium pallidum TaxID=2172098 RepID=A0A2S1SF01_9FLAO|nr:IPExxxVDY family protein [Flavobacterium pallidum]AWI24980.1 IPExxxVDY family protein [Flavobacterium pallidum]